MTLVLDATVGGAASNAYATEAVITALLEGRVNSATWTAATTAVREQAIVNATRRLEQETFHGYRASESQALKWPRSGVYDSDGYAYASDAMPAPILMATAELALALVTNPSQLDTSGLAQFTSLSVGPISLSTRDAALAPNALPATVRGFLNGLSVTGGGGLTRLVRG